VLTTPDETTQGAAGESPHFVRFYDDDANLLDDVSDFIDSALRAGGTGIVVASAAHIADLRRRLAGLGNSEGAPAWFSGRLLLLDVEETLGQFMVDGWPDARRFHATIGAVMAEACAGGAGVHAFGEMVALLCERGLYDAAVRLEQLWNELAATLDFSLFCAYPWRLFAQDEHMTAFDRVCAEHVRCSHTRALRRPAPGRDVALETEIVRRKEAEQTLRRREKEFADFVENAAEGLHRVAGDGTILWANRAELQMLGYAWEEYVGRHIAEFHVDAPVIEHILKTLASGGTLYDQPARLRCKDGSIKHVVIHSNGCFEDGQLRYTRCFTRDATERYQRDEALAQRDRMLLNAPVAAALLTGPAFTFRLANRRFCELVGRDSLDGKTFAGAFPALQTGEFAALLEQVYRSAAPASADELRVELARADGRREERFLKLSLEPLSAAPAPGSEQGVILVAVDVTEEVRSRRALARAHDERERLVAELTAANRTKDEFLAMLGHELRNPLSPIVTALQLMRMRGEEGALREREIIERQVEHLVRLVDDLMDVARATRGQIELKFEQVEIAQTLHKAVEMASLLLEQRGHAIELGIESGLHWEGDPMRLAQVVSNLLTNAARYTEPGGRVVLRARRDGPGWLRISVTDNGIGLAPEMLTQVFGLFFQGKRSMDRNEGGLGIGLALVKNIVELHGGRVEARSEGVGRGSEFLVRLPMVSTGAGSASVAIDAPALAAPAAPQRRIMVVDDNADAAEMLGLLLMAHGHQVEVFNDPVSALEAAGRMHPDIAVLDIGLPVLDGYELAVRLRALLGDHPCRLVALSGYGQDADRSRSEQAGFERHLVKPITPEQVARLADASPDGA